MRQAFEIVLRLYPRDYRARFACEMSSAFEEALVDRRRHGWRSSAKFGVFELTGLLIAAGSEWIAKLTSDTSIRGRSLPDRLLMRPPGVSWEAHYGPACPRIPQR